MTARHAPVNLKYDEASLSAGDRKALPKLVEEFLKYVLSKEGQEIVVKDGYDPLTAKLVDTQLKSLK